MRSIASRRALRQNAPLLRAARCSDESRLSASAAGAGGES